MYIHDKIKDHELLSRRCRREDFLTTEEQVAICLRYLATGASFDTVGNELGCHKTSVSRVVRDVMAAMLDVATGLTAQHLSFPSTKEQLMVNRAGFQAYVTRRQYTGRALPQVVGAMDGTQVPIKPPPDAGQGYRNRKSKNAVNVHAVCDHVGRFMDVLAGFSGRHNDITVLKESGLGKELFDDASDLAALLDSGTVELCGVSVPFQFIGDSAYPCRKYILPALTDPEIRAAAQGVADTMFNTKLASTRNIIERAFGVLKNRWRVLLAGVTTDIKVVPDVIIVCFLLHNICLDKMEDAPEPAPPADWAEYEAAMAAANIVDLALRPMPIAANVRAQGGRGRGRPRIHVPRPLNTADDLEVGKRIRYATIHYLTLPRD